MVKILLIRSIGTKWLHANGLDQMLARGRHWIEGAVVETDAETAKKLIDDTLGCPPSQWADFFPAKPQSVESLEVANDVA